MRATLGAVNFVKMGQRELELVGQLLSSRPELSSWERRKLVEERLDDCGIHDNHSDLKHEPGMELGETTRAQHS